MAKNRETVWLDAWYGQRKWTLWLLPLMWLFRGLTAVRRYWLTRYCQQPLQVPVVIVGNISVGGTGKTPLLIALVEHLQAQGFTPGVVSRGYGARAPHYPYLLTPQSPVTATGDEPYAIYQQTGCAVCIGPDRAASAHLLEQQGCNVLISDDGLQHYRLERDIEIAVIDGQRGFGNGFCLPVGPLREPVTRLHSVDFVIVNGSGQAAVETQHKARFSMTIAADIWQTLVDGQSHPLDHLPAGTRVHAIAGIGNPRRFYHTLRELQLDVVEHDFPDHHAYDTQDFNFTEALPVVMTVKDAVKCSAFARPDWYALHIQAKLPVEFWQQFDARLATIVEKNIHYE